MSETGRGSGAGTGGSGAALDRAKGALVGLACGDAVGCTVEFRARGSFPPMTDMVGGGTFGLEPGQWTDDTSLALCLAESLLESGGFDPVDQLRRYVRWYREGHLSSTGRCFDIGTTTRRALETFERTGSADGAPADPFAAGNGSIMRLAPVMLAYHPDADRARVFAAESSRTTHAAEEAVACCEILSDVVTALLRGASKEEAVTSARPSRSGGGLLAEIADGRYREKAEDGVRGSGYVVESLEAALWCFWHARSFEDAVLRAANLGDDADTTAAVCGQLAGAHWGLAGIPEGWLAKLHMRAKIEAFASELYAARW